MNRPDQAANLFDQGYSCSQSNLAIYGPPLGLEKQYGSKNCRDLLGFDLSTPQGREQAKIDGSFDICTNLIRTAAQIAEEILDVQ